MEWPGRAPASVTTTLHRSRGGQFVAHVAALPGNPDDGHTRARQEFQLIYVPLSMCNPNITIQSAPKEMPSIRAIAASSIQHS
ncbi:MAG TPA: hypothetical protein VLJ17_00840 [Xanthobacteraceae bacterium]|nr:hypothetical protein [Xanthobacteraceae bacterium]